MSKEEVSFLMSEYPHMPKILNINKASVSALDRWRHIKKVLQGGQDGRQMGGANDR